MRGSLPSYPSLLSLASIHARLLYPKCAQLTLALGPANCFPPGHRPPLELDVGKGHWALAGAFPSPLQWQAPSGSILRDWQGMPKVPQKGHVGTEDDCGDCYGLGLATVEYKTGQVPMHGHRCAYRHTRTIHEPHE